MGMAFANASQLLQLPAFQWFLQECVMVKFKEQRAIALNRQRTPEDRDVALAIADSLEDVLKWAEERAESAAEFLRHE